MSNEATATTPITGVDFVTIPTKDYEASAEFYGETLGLPFVKRWGDMPAGEFQAGDLTLAIMQMDAFGQEFNPNQGAVVFQVADFEAAKAELESRGVTYLMDTIDSGVCNQVYFQDPDGNAVGIHNRYSEGQPPGE